MTLLIYISTVLLICNFISGSFTIGKTQKHSCHHHLDMVCLNGDDSRSFSIPIDMAFLCKGLTSCSTPISWRMEIP